MVRNLHAKLEEEIVLADNGFGLEVSPKAIASITTAVGFGIFPTISGAITIGSFYGLWIYHGDIGTATVGRTVVLSLGITVNNAPTYSSSFVRLYNHSLGGNLVDFAFYFCDNVGTTHLFCFEAGGSIAPVEAGGTGDITFSSTWKKISVQIGAITYYLVASRFA